VLKAKKVKTVLENLNMVKRKKEVQNEVSS